MINKEALLIEKKSITEWIVRAYRWIDKTVESFSQAGAVVIDRLPTAYSDTQKWFWQMGRRMSAAEAMETITRLDMRFETVDGAESCFAYMRGIMSAAQARIDEIDLALCSSQPPSSSSDMAGTEAANSQTGIPASKKRYAPAKA